jgi:hypothetical protein
MSRVKPIPIDRKSKKIGIENGVVPGTIVLPGRGSQTRRADHLLPEGIVRRGQRKEDIVTVDEKTRLIH